MRPFWNGPGGIDHAEAAESAEGGKERRGKGLADQLSKDDFPQRRAAITVETHKSA